MPKLFSVLGTSHLLPAGGGGYIQGGSEIFLVMYWGGGVKIKWPMGRGGHVFRQVLGGSDVFHWSFFSLKVIASEGQRPPDPPYIPAL